MSWFRTTLYVLVLLAPLAAQSGVRALDLQLEQRLKLPESQSTIGSIQVYQEFEDLFDKELNRAYSTLMKELQGPTKAAFQKAQKAWLLFRDSQFEAFRAIYDRREFGTGQGQIIAMNRMNLVRQRALELSSYTNGLWGPENDSSK